MNTRIIESNAEWMHDLLNITKLIGERLTPSKLSQYMDLLKLFRSRRIQGYELIRSLQILFEEDEHLSQMFNEVIRSLLVLFEEDERLPQMLNELTDEEIRELENNELRREERRRCRVRLRCEIGRDEADKPLKKRSKYRVEPTGTVLGTHEFKSEINQNCGQVKNQNLVFHVEGDNDGGRRQRNQIFDFPTLPFRLNARRTIYFNL